jgi:trimeric autotransporter adhesin
VNHIALALGIFYWGGLGYGTRGYVLGLSIDPANKGVYVSGQFDGPCDTPDCLNPTVLSRNILRWDYATPAGYWSGLGTGLLDGFVMTVAWNKSANLLYAGGDFGQAGSVPASGLAAWNNSSWSGVGTGSGLSPQVHAFAADGKGRVYVGGDFRTVGSLFVNRIAAWNINERTWSALGQGVSGPVRALTLDTAGNLYVGGLFSFLCGNADCTSNGQQVNKIAKWTPNGDSGSWSGLGQGFDNNVFSLALDHNNILYAGGLFTNICGDLNCSSQSRANRVAFWDGHNWFKLGTGLTNSVDALAVDMDNNLYAGGDFLYFCGNEECTTQGQRINHVARWTPSGGGNWVPVGNGVDDSVRALAIDRHNTLYAGGLFDYICSAPGCSLNTQRASGIAQWNGTWSSVGHGFRDYGIVNALALDEGNNNLYAGGHFQTLCGDAGCYTAGTAVNNIARWDGSNWSALGSGLGPFPFSGTSALNISRGSAWVGGSFATAGDKISANFAQYTYGAYIFLPLILR